jgi:hypothetical protein
MGAAGTVSEMSSNPYWSHNSYLGHYFFANETKKLIGASPVRTAFVTFQPTPNFDKHGYRNPIMLYGPAISALMHGARGIGFYGQSYLFGGGDHDAGPWVEKIFNLTAYLEQKGLLDYRVPRRVALLYSRASEDWWQLAHAANPVEAAEGVLYQNAVMEVLFRHGIPFELYYLDQPSALDELGNYALAILPYPYSVSVEAATKIRSALAKGTKVVSLRHDGEVDPFAERYPTPLLRGVPGITNLSIDLTKSSYDELSAQLMEAVTDTVDGPPLLLNANGKDVECSIQENKSDRLVFCLNWEMRPVEVNLGINLAAGRYKASVVTLDRESPAGVGGKSDLAPDDLRSFRLVLAPGEAKILLFTRRSENPVAG